MSPGMTWKARGKRPVNQSQLLKSYYLGPVELTLKVTFHFETAIPKPLCNQETPGQHPLKQTTELSTILRGCDLRLVSTSAEPHARKTNDLRNTSEQQQRATQQQYPQ